MNKIAMRPDLLIEPVTGEVERSRGARVDGKRKSMKCGPPPSRRAVLKRFTPRKTRRDYKVAYNDPDLFRRRARRPHSKAKLDKFQGVQFRLYKPTVKVTHRSPKQVGDYQRRKQWAERQKKNRNNLIDYFSVPLSRDIQDLLSISDEDRRQNKKLVGEAIGEVIGEMMLVLLDLQSQLGLADKNDKLAINKVRLAVRGKRYPHRGSNIPESGDIIER